MGKVVIDLDRAADAPHPFPAGAAAAVPRDATYLITGGLGGFGPALARRLAAQGAGTSRSPRPPRADGGGGLEWPRCAPRASRSCCSPPTSAAPRTSRGAGRLRPRGRAAQGVFHAAMVLDDAPLSDLDRRRASGACWRPRPRAPGTSTWPRSARELDLFVLFSSHHRSRQRRAGELRGRERLPRRARARRRAQGLPALAVNWGVISDVGYVAERKEPGERWPRQGQHGLTAEQAFAAHRGAARPRRRAGHHLAHRVAGVGGGQPGDGRPRASAPCRGPPRRGADKGPSGARRDRPAAGPRRCAPRAVEVAEHMRRRMAKILGAAPERVDPACPSPSWAWTR